MPVFSDVFTEMAAVLAVAAAVSATGTLLRQPLIVAYIAAGVLVGPAGLGWVARGDALDLLAHMGIALLLFVVGLKLAPQLIRKLGRVVLAVSVVQMTVTAVLGYGLGLLLGLSFVTALYVGLGMAISSTIIIVKLLSDKREIDALHGRLALGILIVQDVVAVGAMALLTAFDDTAGEVLGRNILLLPLKGALFLLSVALIARYVLPRLLHFLARSPELLVLAAIAWAVTLAAASHGFGFSKEVGALVAGVALATTPYREAIGARLTALRDFLLLFFFIDLGAQLELGLLGSQLGAAVALSAFVLLVKPLIIMALLGFAGYRRRTLGLTALSMGQVSIFSLILAAMGLHIGHLDTATAGLITLVALITMTFSSYLIDYAHPLYARLEPWLGRFERRQPHREEEAPTIKKVGADIIIFGLGRYGERLALGLEARGLSVLGVDFDPELVRGGITLGIPARYGDAQDSELVGSLPLARASWVVSSIREPEVNLTLLDTLRHRQYQGRVAVAAHSDHDAVTLKAAGAELVLRPFKDAADQAADLVTGRDKRVLPLDLPPEEEAAT